MYHLLKKKNKLDKGLQVNEVTYLEARYSESQV